MGHDHHEEPYKIPSYQIYKVENVPELMAVQQALAAKGLCDPWLRNEVWRYNPKEFSTHKLRFKTFFSRGLAMGFGLTCLTLICEKLYEKAVPSGRGGHCTH